MNAVHVWSMIKSGSMNMQTTSKKSKLGLGNPLAYTCFLPIPSRVLRERLQKRKIECKADSLVPMRLAIFPFHLSKVLTALATKKWCQVIWSAAPVTQNHLSKLDDLMLQNATPLRKSAHGPPNMSDSCVSCIAPAMRNASLQILFKCPTPAKVFETATKPSRLPHF